MTKKLIMAGVLATAVSLPSVAGVVVIGHASNPGMDTAAITNLYLGRVTQVNGGKAALVDLPEGHAARTEFHAKTTGRTDAQLQSNWARLTFTGKATAPTIANDDAAVVKMVAENPNAVGYVDEASVTGDVKVLLKF